MTLAKHPKTKRSARGLGGAGRSKWRGARIGKWSQRVTETSDAMDLQANVFKRTPRAIAASLKRSAERSHRRKSPPYRSAMSMLTFYINRGGRNLSAAQRAKLEKAKDELRRLFGKKPRASA
jgi:hypothetical protein